MVSVLGLVTSKVPTRDPGGVGLKFGVQSVEGG